MMDNGDGSPVDVDACDLYQELYNLKKLKIDLITLGIAGDDADLTIYLGESLPGNPEVDNPP